MRVLLALLLVGAGSASAWTVRLPTKPFPMNLLAGPPILPNGLLVNEADGLRTLELDELAPLRLRLSIRF